MASEIEDGWYEKIPKVELHLHLEGAIPFEALWQLVEKYGGDPSLPNPEALATRFIYRDFPHFIETWTWKNRFLRQYEDFTFIAEAVAGDLLAQNIYYAEVFFSPPDFRRHGLQTQPLAEAIRAGLERVPQVKVMLVADLVRDFGPELAAITLQEVAEARGAGIIGVGLGGSEQDFPPELFQEVFAQARQLGFHTSAHAGEAASAQSVWGAIRSLHVDRIGHATRAVEDERTLDHLAEARIPLELCPLSNLRTGVVKSLAEHPVRLYFERRLNISINTDDPKMFGNTLAEEYRQLVEVQGFSRREICSLILQGIAAAWLPQEEKCQLVERFSADPAWQGTSKN
jgi:adenosine deaminase